MRILNAGHPLVPSLSPILNELSDVMLDITMPIIPTNSNGGSPIISYSLEIDNGLGGNFTVLGGFDEVLMETEYIINPPFVIRGLTHRLRYRVLNLVGWSDYSPYLYALVATYPS